MLTKVRQFTRVQFFLIPILALALLALPGAAQASLLCRSDPVVLLSNGVTLDLSADISGYAWQVNQVQYELHVPVGVSPILVVHTKAWLTSQEMFTFYADQQPGQYKTVTTVQTTQGNAAVVADDQLVSLSLVLANTSVSGMEGQGLKLFLTT